MSEATELLGDADVKDNVIEVLAEFFEDSFREDAAGVGDWLVRNGTSVDLFVELVAALHRPVGCAATGDQQS
jgi:hypothetical protein